MEQRETKANPGYEERDVSTKKILLWGIGGLVLIVIILIILAEYFLFVKEDYYFKIVEEPRSKELLELRERETEELNGYGLLDDEKGVYRIPIERAMELTIKEASK